MSSFPCLCVLTYLLAVTGGEAQVGSEAAQHLCCTTGSTVLKIGERLISLQKFLRRINELVGTQPCNAFGWGTCNKYGEKDLYVQEYRMEPIYKVVVKNCPPDVTVCCKGYYKIDHPYLSGQCFDLNDRELSKLLKTSLEFLKKMHQSDPKDEVIEKLLQQLI